VTTAIRVPELGDGIVTLRAWTRADAPALRPACGEEAICAYSTVPWRFTLDAARAWVDRQEAKRLAGRGVTLAIVPRDEGDQASPFGTVVLTLQPQEATARMGYWLVGAARGRGYAARAGRLLVDWARRELALRRIELVILPGNLASRRVAAALGATNLGLHPGLAHHGDRREDALLYRIEA